MQADSSRLPSSGRPRSRRPRAQTRSPKFLPELNGLFKRARPRPKRWPASGTRCVCRCPTFAALTVGSTPPRLRPRSTSPISSFDTRCVRPGPRSRQRQTPRQRTPSSSATRASSRPRAYSSQTNLRSETGCLPTAAVEWPDRYGAHALRAPPAGGVALGDGAGWGWRGGTD